MQDLSREETEFVKGEFKKHFAEAAEAIARSNAQQGDVLSLAMYMAFRQGYIVGKDTEHSFHAQNDFHLVDDLIDALCPAGQADEAQTEAREAWGRILLTYGMP